MINNLLIRTYNIVFRIVRSDFEVNFEPTFIFHGDYLGEIAFVGIAHKSNCIIWKSNITKSWISFFHHSALLRAFAITADLGTSIALKPLKRGHYLSIMIINGICYNKCNLLSTFTLGRGEFKSVIVVGSYLRWSTELILMEKWKSNLKIISIKNSFVKHQTINLLQGVSSLI